MNPTYAMKVPVQLMSSEELKYALAYCDNEVRRSTSNGARLDMYENRRQEVEGEIQRRKHGEQK